MLHHQLISTQDRVALIVAQLVRRSCWFAVLPLPDDLWEVTVKVENANMLTRLAYRDMVVDDIQQFFDARNLCQSDEEAVRVYKLLEDLR